MSKYFPWFMSFACINNCGCSTLCSRGDCFANGEALQAALVCLTNFPPEVSLGAEAIVSPFAHTKSRSCITYLTVDDAVTLLITIVMQSAYFHLDALTIA